MKGQPLLERSWSDVYEVPLSEAMVLCHCLLVYSTPLLKVTVLYHLMAEGNVLMTMEGSVNGLLTEMEATHDKTLLDLN